jgi:hypothetical protein
MQDPTQNPFVVDQLRPVNKDGQSDLMYQLSKASVSPSRIVGRDARGMPKLDTLPTVMWKPFLMLDGCINKVPIRTGSVPSMHQDATAYENETFYDLIVAGCIPSWLCPYSTRFQHITNGPFAEIPPGERDCGGSEQPGGCTHLQRIAHERKQLVLENYQRELATFAAERDQKYDTIRKEMREMVLGIGEAVSERLGTNAPQAQPSTPEPEPVPQPAASIQNAEARRQRLREGRSDRIQHDKDDE